MTNTGKIMDKNLEIIEKSNIGDAVKGLACFPGSPPEKFLGHIHHIEIHPDFGKTLYVTTEKNIKGKKFGERDRLVISAGGTCQLTEYIGNHD